MENRTILFNAAENMPDGAQRSIQVTLRVTRDGQIASVELTEPGYEQVGGIA